MESYSYDGSFESLISLCARLILKKIEPDEIVSSEKAEESLFNNINLEFDQNLYERLSSKLEKISQNAFIHICLAFLSEISGAEMIIYNYIRTALEIDRNSELSSKKEKEDYLENYTDDSVKKIKDLSRKVNVERHRLLGLLRFSELSDGTLYSQYEPDHNITVLVAPHFKKRIPKENWIIHDLSRGIGAVYDSNRKEYIICGRQNDSDIMFSGEETVFRNIWQRYWKEIAITERKNPRCQKNFMPKRYWKHLTEKM